MHFKNMTATAALLLAFAAPAFAQQPAQPRTPARPASGWTDEGEGRGPRGLNIELALRHKEDLKLSDAQVSQLDAVRKEIVAEKQARASQMIDIQSRVASGLLKREDVRKQFEDKRDDIRKTMEARQDRVAKILTQEQQDKLRDGERREMQKRMRAGGMGQGRMGQGRMGQGMRGRNMGPGGMQGRMRPRMRGGFNPGMPGFGERRPMRPGMPDRPGFDDDEEQLNDEPVR